MMGAFASVVAVVEKQKLLDWLASHRLDSTRFAAAKDNKQRWRVLYGMKMSPVQRKAFLAQSKAAIGDLAAACAV